jgi:hypothetical protein
MHWCWKTPVENAPRTSIEKDLSWFSDIPPASRFPPHRSRPAGYLPNRQPATVGAEERGGRGTTRLTSSARQSLRALVMQSSAPAPGAPSPWDSALGAIEDTSRPSHPGQQDGGKTDVLSSANHPSTVAPQRRCHRTSASAWSPSWPPMPRPHLQRAATVRQKKIQLPIAEQNFSIFTCVHVCARTKLCFCKNNKRRIINVCSIVKVCACSSVCV